MPPGPWQQHNIFFTDRTTAQQTITDRLGPAVIAAEADGQLTGFWFMNKQPWPLRHRGPASPTVDALLSDLVNEGPVTAWHWGIYEPETVAFGGEAAMAASHDLFHHDSRHLLTYRPGPNHLGRRETTVVLISAMMRAAGLDWYEQGDVWAQVASLRPPADPLPPERAASLIPAMRKLMTADARSLHRPAGPLAGHAAWVHAFEQAGTQLACLAHRGELTRGLRAVIAHHAIFHANRAGMPLNDQSSLSTLAKETIMGTPERSHAAASRPGTPTKAASVSAVNATLTARDAEADRLRNALVDQVLKEDRLHTPRIESVLRTVPRHLFVPEAPLDSAYANAPVHIKHTADGTSISCASQPGVVALMLEQLQAQPGEHILELGAGTGYNAALLARLVGDDGRVTTLDIDDDLVESARAHLTAAGIANATVLCRDGALGHPDSAPYDRIVATVGAHGIPHAWMDQLAPGGRLLVPQRLKGSVCRSIAYENRHGRWTSIDSRMNTFMPLRNGIADDDRRIIPLSANGAVRLQTHTGQDVDADALRDVLNQPRTEEWTGMTVRAMESPEWMELFVTCSLPNGLNRMLFDQTAKGRLLTDDPYPSSAATIDNGALAYLARRPSNQTTPEGGKLWEFGVIGHGPGSTELAREVAQTIRTWDREYRGREATFEIQPLHAPAIEQRPGTFTLTTPLNRINVDWQ